MSSSDLSRPEVESPYISTRTLTGDELRQLRLQCEQDTLWCLPCQLAGYSILATVRVYMAEGSVRSSILLCPTCSHHRLMNSLACDTGSEPVKQPAWTELVRQIFHRLEFVDRAISGGVGGKSNGR